LCSFARLNDSYQNPDKRKRRTFTAMSIQHEPGAAEPQGIEVSRVKSAEAPVANRAAVWFD
jgi:hypothetical protein